MTDILLIDNSNIFIGLNKFSKLDSIFSRLRVRFDYIGFTKLLFDNEKQVEKILVGSTPPPTDNFWMLMRKKGFTVTTFERTKHGEKAVDTELVAQGLDALNNYHEPGRLVLMSGDSDMLPLVQRAHTKGWEVIVWTWKDSINPNYAQSESIDSVKFIDDIQDEYVFFEPTEDNPLRETLGQRKHREEEEEIARQEERERRRIEQEKEKEERARKRRIELEEQKEKQSVDNANTVKKVLIRSGAFALLAAGVIFISKKN